MAHDHRAYQAGKSGNFPTSSKREYMNAWWGGKRDRAFADSIGGALKRLGESFDRIGASPVRTAAPPPVPVTPQHVQGYQAPLPGYAQTSSMPVTEVPAANISYYPYESRRSRLPGVLRSSWWKEETVLYRVMVAGYALARSRKLQAIAGVIGAISVFAVVFGRPDLWFTQNETVPFIYGLLGGVAAFAGSWLLGRVLVLAATVLSVIASFLAWALLLGSVGGILYGSVLLAMRSGLLH